MSGRRIRIIGGKFGQVSHPHRHSPKVPRNIFLKTAICRAVLPMWSEPRITWQNFLKEVTIFYDIQPNTAKESEQKKHVFPTNSTTKPNSSPESHPCHGHPPPQPRGMSVFHLLLVFSEDFGISGWHWHIEINSWNERKRDFKKVSWEVGEIIFRWQAPKKTWKKTSFFEANILWLVNLAI